MYFRSEVATGSNRPTQAMPWMSEMSDLATWPAFNGWDRKRRRRGVRLDDSQWSDENPKRRVPIKSLEPRRNKHNKPPSIFREADRSKG